MATNALQMGKSKARGGPPYLVVTPPESSFESPQVIKHIKGGTKQPNHQTFLQFFSSAIVWKEWTSWPEPIRAKSPDNVATLVLLFPARYDKTRYRDRQDRITDVYRQTHLVWVYDWQSKELVDYTELEGGIRGT